MNEKNKIKSKAWPLAAAALALGLGGVVGASAVYADRADNAANLRPSQSVKMRVEFNEGEDAWKFLVPYGTYRSISNDAVVLDEDVTLVNGTSPSTIAYGDSPLGAYYSADELPVLDVAWETDAYVVRVDSSDWVAASYYYLQISMLGSDNLGVDVHFCFQANAGDSWSVSYNESEMEYYNLNSASKGLIAETFDAVAGGVTGVASTIGTGVTSVVGLFWDVENVKFTTLGTLTLVGLAAGLVYFAIRTIYRAVNGVA